MQTLHWHTYRGQKSTQFNFRSDASSATAIVCDRFNHSTILHKAVYTTETNGANKNTYCSSHSNKNPSLWIQYKCIQQNSIDGRKIEKYSHIVRCNMGLAIGNLFESIKIRELFRLNGMRKVIRF